MGIKNYACYGNKTHGINKRAILKYITGYEKKKAMREITFRAWVVNHLLQGYMYKVCSVRWDYIRL